MSTSLGDEEAFLLAILSYHSTPLLGNYEQVQAPLQGCHLKYLKKFH